MDDIETYSQDAYGLEMHGLRIYRGTCISFFTHVLIRSLFFP